MNEIIYYEEETDLTAEEFRAQLEKFAEQENAELIANEDGSYTIVAPDGDRVTVGQIWE